MAFKLNIGGGAAAQAKADEASLDRSISLYKLGKETKNSALSSSAFKEIQRLTDGVVDGDFQEENLVGDAIVSLRDRHKAGEITKRQFAEELQFVAAATPFKEGSERATQLSESLLAAAPGEERGKALELEQFSKTQPQAFEAGGGEQALQQLRSRDEGSTQFSRQVERINVPVEGDKFQTMVLDRTTGQVSPATTEDGQPIILTEKQLLLSEGKKANSLIDPFTNKFLGEFGKDEGKRISALRETAVEAIASKKIISEGRKLVAEGFYTGSAANIKKSLDKWLQQAGINVGGRKAANTEAYASMMGLQVGKIIKQFGAGTGLSDADREYAENIVAGKVTLTADAIRRLLDINDRIATFTVEAFNSQAADAKNRIKEKDPFRPIDIPDFGDATQGVPGADIEAKKRRIAELKAKQAK